MSSSKKLLQSASGFIDQSGSTNIEDVFSTHLYRGTNADNNVRVNGIDLLNEGGLVWIKARSAAGDYRLVDTARGDRKLLSSNKNDAELTDQGSTYGLNFNNNGFTVRQEYNGGMNGNQDYVSWSFRKARKFFDVVTYTGNGSTQTISHNLGTTVGFIIVKCTSTTNDWAIYHRSYGGGYYFRTAPYGTDAAAGNANYWNNTNATSSVFSVGANSATNQSGQSYIAYLFAHDTSDEGLIQCGKYTGNGSATAGPHINLGFEPQWLLVKSTANSTNWSISDTMRGLHHGNEIQLLYPHLNNAEADISTTPSQVAPTPTGFQVNSTGTNFNTNSTDYIYMAIRKGPMATPTSSSSIFGIKAVTLDATIGAIYDIGIEHDMVIGSGRTGSGVSTVSKRIQSRVIGMGKVGRNAQQLDTTSTASENGRSDFLQAAFSNKAIQTDSNLFSSTYVNTAIFWAWRRAPEFFDAIAYAGNDTAGRTLTHNLGVTPEMMWIKGRNVAQPWRVYHSAVGHGRALNLADYSTVANNVYYLNNTAPTSTVITLGQDDSTNGFYNYVVYLFATLAGISKVGTFSHTNGSSTDVDCGFSSGAKFILARKAGGSGGIDTSTTGNWYLWDTTRGIVSGNDPYLRLDTTESETTSTDYIHPRNSGFQVSSGYATGTYIFYAIAT